jgi:short subunit dehydrogenase-like uncharacterized protein
MRLHTQRIVYGMGIKPHVQQLLQGIKAPESGHWMNNPHADDLDYQIESDFAGLMSPGMPNTASAISDKIGHIMTYGDGWYGGVM